MSEELDRIVKRIEDEARRLATGDLDQDSAADAAAEVARLAGEAAAIVDGFARAAKPIPAAPGQGRLPMESSSRSGR